MHTKPKIPIPNLQLHDVLKYNGIKYICCIIIDLV